MCSIAYILSLHISPYRFQTLSSTFELLSHIDRVPSFRLCTAFVCMLLKGASVHPPHHPVPISNTYRWTKEDLITRDTAICKSTRGCEVGLVVGGWPSNTHSLAESGPPNFGTDLKYGTCYNNQRKNDNRNLNSPVSWYRLV